MNFRLMTRLALFVGLTLAWHANLTARAEDAETVWADDVDGSLWTARGGAIIWERTRPDRTALLSDAGLLTTVLDAADFDFGYEPGFEVSLLRHGLGCWDVELRYLQNDAWNARVNVANAGLVQVNNQPTPNTVGAAGPVTTDATYASELHNGEVNLRRAATDGLTWLVGFRYLELDERLAMTFTDPGLAAPQRNDYATRNRLYGAQLGLDKLIWLTDRLELGLGVRGGLFHNSAAQSGLFDDGVNPPIVLGATTDGAALLGEANLSLTYQLTPAFSLRGAYGILGLSEVALASDQVQASDFVGPAPAASVNRDNVVYHGAFVGLEYRR